MGAYGLAGGLVNKCIYIYILYIYIYYIYFYIHGLVNQNLVQTNGRSRRGIITVCCGHSDDATLCYLQLMEILLMTAIC